MSNYFPSTVIMKGKKSNKNKAKSAESDLEESMEEVKLTPLKGIEKMPASKVPSAQKPKSEDVMSIDLMLNAAKKKKKPRGEVEMGPTEVEGKTYGTPGSNKYTEALKKFKKR